MESLNTQQPQILVVDDSLAMCQYLCALFSELGVDNIEHRQDGQSALDLIEQNPTRFDAVFVDLHMDGMDGLELLSRLNKIYYRGGIIIMSALDKKILDFAFEIVSNFNLRVLGSIEKPIDKSLLAFLLRRIQNHKPGKIEKNRFIKRRDLFDAIKHNNILTWFQPKISQIDNTLMGLECLVRLRSPDQSILTPQYFIAVAEKFGLIEALMESILDAALPQYLEFMETTHIKPSLSFNISPLQLHNDMLPDILAEYLEKYGVNKSQVILEITENHAIREEIQLKNLNRLRIHGFQLSLDDYGAGYTNLRQLKSMPFNEIKIDAALVDGISRDKVLQIIVKSIAKVCSQLEISLIAEGITQSEDLEALDKIGVDGYQGYIFCRPKPLEELIRWHNVWESTVSATAKSAYLPKPSSDSGSQLRSIKK